MYLCGIVRSSFIHEKTMVTLENIQAKISKLQAQAEQIATKQMSGAIEKIRGLMEKHGVTIADIETHASRKVRGRKPQTDVTGKQPKVAAQYRDPKTGATWSGRGRAPAWIASVKDRSKFLIDGSSQVSAPGTKGANKASKRAIGPQPAMYADPKTGVTWSGRGRAPAWIAKAKDRTKFLIAGVDRSTGKEPALATKKAGPAGKAVSKGSAPAKEAASKKVAPTTKAVTQKVVGKRASTTKKSLAKTVSAKKTSTGKRTLTSSAVAVDVPLQSSEAVNAPSEA
jgi:DNA-binding protein H-NS